MIKKMGYQWHLRKLMAEQEMFQTSDLVPLLAERGVTLSREQVYRLVTQPPQRMSMDTLVALCDILQCTPNDLIKPEAVNTSSPRSSATPTPPRSHRAEPSFAAPGSREPKAEKSAGPRGGQGQHHRSRPATDSGTDRAGGSGRS